MAKRIAIIGAGPAGLMAAEVLSQYDVQVDVFEQKPSAARKFLMAGKTGLNISHAEPVEQFIGRYDQAEWLAPWIREWDAPLLRAWLKRLVESGVKFYYRHQCLSLKEHTLEIKSLLSDQVHSQNYDAIVLACGAVSWPQLGSYGAWQNWLEADEIEPFQASNAGVEHEWSTYMQPVFGQPLKRIAAWVGDAEKSMGDIVITHYGLESGLVYKQGRALRAQQKQLQPLVLTLDLLPDVTVQELAVRLKPTKKQSLSNVWRKAGLDAAKASLVRELVAKDHWNHPEQLAQQVKQLQIPLTGFRPIEEAISCAGGVRREVLSSQLQLKSNPAVFLCGEMLDWDAPTGGYLLTACFATGRAAGEGVMQYLNVAKKSP